MRNFKQKISDLLYAALIKLIVKTLYSKTLKSNSSAGAVRDSYRYYVNSNGELIYEDHAKRLKIVGLHDEYNLIEPSFMGHRIQDEKE